VFATSSEVATVFGATGQTGTGYVIALGYQTADVVVASELRTLDLTRSARRIPNMPARRVVRRVSPRDLRGSTAIV